jgi:Domain of unknown function (DUF3943)
MKPTNTYLSNNLRQIKSKLLLTILLANYYLYTSSQEINIYNNLLPAVRVNTPGITPAGKYNKRFGRASLEWAAAQILPWAVNRYVRKEEFAKVTGKSILHNLKPSSMEWDDNQFFNNQFAHPYQGSLYFNSFRTNGYNFWESVPAVFVGTYTWETICETHLPAPNDLINTSLGGIIFGEMTNRLSNVILRRKAGKSKGIFREPFAFIINPVGSVNRLMDNRNRNSVQQAGVDYSPVSIVADAGLRHISAKVKSGSANYKKEIFGRIHLQYGDPFRDFKEPFSNFSLITEIGNSDSAKANTLQIEGCIYGRKIKQTDKSDLVFSLSMNYDFFSNSSFVFGVQSFGANWLSRFYLSKNVQMQIKGGAGIIPLAALPNPYMYYGEGRKYDYGSGVNIKAGAGINIANRFCYNFNFTGGEAITINGYNSAHSFYSTSSNLRLVIYKGLSFNATSNNYIFSGNYKDYPDVKEHHVFRNFSIGYIIHL